MLFVGVRVVQFSCEANNMFRIYLCSNWIHHTVCDVWSRVGSVCCMFLLGSRLFVGSRFFVCLSMLD